MVASPALSLGNTGGLRKTTRPRKFTGLSKIASPSTLSVRSMNVGVACSLTSATWSVRLRKARTVLGQLGEEQLQDSNALPIVVPPGVVAFMAFPGSSEGARRSPALMGSEVDAILTGTRPVRATGTA